MTGEWESALVYTPPGYDENTDRVYPVLYLQHGHGENQTGWTAAGKVNFILDNLIAEGKAVPFLVIMNNGMVQTAAGEWRRVVDHTLFPELLMKDIIPWAHEPVPDRRGERIPGDGRSVHGLNPDGGHHVHLSGVFQLRRNLQAGSLHDFIQGHGQMDMIRRGPSENAHLKALDDPEKFRKDSRVFFRGIGKSDPFLDVFPEDEKLLEERSISCEEDVQRSSSTEVCEKVYPGFRTINFQGVNIRRHSRRRRSDRIQIKI